MTNIFMTFNRNYLNFLELVHLRPSITGALHRRRDRHRGEATFEVIDGKVQAGRRADALDSQTVSVSVDSHMGDGIGL
jgi:hypothetical protein